MTGEALLWITVAAAVGGILKGSIGFGLGTVGTVLLALALPVEIAVAIMLLPLVIANLVVVVDAPFTKLKGCAHEYWLFVVATVAATVSGFFLIQQVPEQVLQAGMGALIIGYVYSQQQVVPRPQLTGGTGQTQSWYGQSLIGGTMGAVFGASNIGTGIVAYIDSLHLEQRMFVALNGLAVLAGTTLRIPFVLTGQGINILLYSIYAMVLAGTMTFLGTRIGSVMPERLLRTGVTVLLGVVGIHLLLSAV